MQAAASGNSMEPRRITVPTNVRPKHFRLVIEPDLKAFTFTVLETIFVQVHEATDTITANAQDLDVSEVFVSCRGHKQPASVSYDTTRNTVSFKVASGLQKGDEAEVTMKIAAMLGTSLAGFYRNKYMVGDEERWGAATMFEPIDARRALVCWDEPNVKATYDVTLIIPKDRMGMSNMHVIREESVSDTKKALHFATSPIMSSYLLAYVVGEWDMIQTTSSDGVLVRVFTPLGLGEQGRFALEIGAKVLPMYKELFGVPYPLSKCDMVTISNFAMGGMENWGLITYRETALLVDPVSSSTYNKQTVATVVAHEVAHQWFGNLVTMDWWTDLWLNEGFATYVEHLATDILHPEYDLWTQYVYGSMFAALSLDSLATSHPIEVPIHDAKDVEAIFDSISYEKGCAVVTMLSNYIGVENLRKGLRNYVAKFAYKNTVSDDLWHALGEASGQPVAALMADWTRQTGYPVITVTEGGPDSAGRKLHLKQERFFIAGPKSDPSLWKVPIGPASARHPKATSFHLLDTREGDLTLPGVGRDDWFVLNSQERGFYRVRYTTEMLSKLKHAIEHNHLSVLDRLGVFDDTVSLARAGYIPVEQALDLVGAFRNDKEYSIWADIVASFTSGWDVLFLFNEEARALWKQYRLHLFANISQHLGLVGQPGDSHGTTLLRERVMLTMARLSDEPKFLQQCRTLFEAFLKDPASCPGDLRTVVWVAMCSIDPDAAFPALIKYFNDPKTGSEDQENLLLPLGLAPGKARKQQLMDMLFNLQIRSQDALYLFRGLAGSEEGLVFAWDAFRSHFAELVKLLPVHTIGRIVELILGSFASADRLEEAVRFFKDCKPPQGVEPQINQALETLQSNVEWKKRDGARVLQWLRTHTHVPASSAHGPVAASP